MDNLFVFFFFPGRWEVFFYNCIILVQNISILSAESRERARSYSHAERELNSEQKMSLMGAAAEGVGSRKAVRFISIHTHNIKEEFSGQNNQAHDKVTFWHVSDHQPCTKQIFTAAARMPGRLHTDTSEFPFRARYVVL